MRIKIMVLLLALAFTPAAAQVKDNPPNSPVVFETDPVLVGAQPFRRLFLDATVVEESSGLTRAFHEPRKCESNPLIKRDKLWEGWGPAFHGTVLKSADKFEMYYLSIGSGHGTFTCLAESQDGLHWTKPILGQVDYEGSKENNFVACASQVLKFSNPPSSDRTWLTCTNQRLGYSPDGLHWTWESNKTELFSSSDVVNFFADPYHNRLAATWKCDNRRHRACGIVYSSDLVNWEKPVRGPVMVADDLDPDATQIYGMPVFAYQGMYIGLPWIYHARYFKWGTYAKPRLYEAQEGSPRTIDVQLAWSWDLVNWTRTPKREPFIGLGKKGAFDSGMILTAREPVLVGDELWFYYGGYNQIHDEGKGVAGAIGMAVLRLDGFCSMQAGKREGWLITRREIFNTPQVTINAKCEPGGYVTADIVDRNNNVIKGFSRRECIAFRGDSVRAELKWTTQAFPADLTDKDKKIRFYIKNADLYAYLPLGINQAIDGGQPTE